MAIIAPTLGDARETCVLGESGVVRINPRVKWQDQRGILTWQNGSQARIFGSFTPEDVERLRGPQHHVVWWDEFAAARYIDEVFDMMNFGLRLGPRPHGIFTSTPKPKAKLKELLKQPETVITKAGTADNTHLADQVRKYYYALYEGTRLGRQELLAEILDDLDGAMWTHEMIQNARDSWPKDGPELLRVVVSVDPAVSSGEKSAETGIIVAARGLDGHGYIIEDCSLRGSPEQWASRAIAAFHRHKADRIVAEINNGGDLVEHTLRSVDPQIPFKSVRASRGKRIRAEPVAALYERRMIHHKTGLDTLEEQLSTWEPDGSGASPDRLDAMVWAVTELALTQETMFTINPEQHVVSAPHTSVPADFRVVEAWRFGWEHPTSIVWLAWKEGKPTYVFAEHEAMGEPKHHAAVAKAIRKLYGVNQDNLISVALPTARTERNFAWEYAHHHVYIGENQEAPSVDARRSRLARELGRTHVTKEGTHRALVIHEKCVKLTQQIRLMRFGDKGEARIVEDETGLADALALAVTTIPEPETPEPENLIEFARDHGLSIPTLSSTMLRAMRVHDDETEEAGFWQPGYE